MALSEDNSSQEDGSWGGVESALLRDAVARTIASPESVHCWHRVGERYAASGDALERSGAVEELRAQLPQTGLAGFYLASFLAWVTNEAGPIADAARLALHFEPLDPDRLSAFACHEWLRWMPGQGNRAAFVEGMKNARLPEITGLLGRHLASKSSIRPCVRSVGKIGKVAIIAPYLANWWHPPTRMAIEHANLLCQSGLDARVFSCQELKVPDGKMLLSNISEVGLDPLDVGSLRGRLDARSALLVLDERFSVMRRWINMLGAVAEWDPDLILFVGLYSPLLTPLSALRPVVGLSVNSVPPIAPVDVWLTADAEQAGKLNESWAPAHRGAWGWNHPFRVPFGSPVTPVARTSLGIPDNAIALVSVGFRLQSEIRGGWAERMLQVLAAHPAAILLLIGGTGQIPPALEGAPAGRILALPSRENVREVIASCDIFVNPPRLGGGFSVADAMAEGVPVLTHADSDGGSKVGAAAVADDDAYFRRLIALIAEPSLRREAGESMLERFRETLDLERSGPSLLAACELARQRFVQRTAATR